MTNEQMLARIRLLEECVEFYANKENWRAVTIQQSPTMNADDLELTDPYEDYHCRRGGRKARQVLSKIKETK